MRLISTTTLEIEEFFDISIPEYAILSHTWGDGEVSLQDWADRKNRRFKPGFQKIMWACNQAVKDKLDYVWVDTNCIDKSSSAELSEAINSMFKWYRRSNICYVYLEDVPAMTLDQCIEPDSVFRSARWFTRGWTLQELIASPNINFFSNDWTAIATKPELALCISEITGIAWSCLLKGRLSKSHPLRRYSVAQRLAWASRRSTTRIEDQAYSLLGLFDITMPLVYGEGHEAFTRLLGEIIHKYADHSFASQLRYVDFLPRSPMEFCDSQSVVVSSSPQLQKHYIPGDHPYPFHLTNTGLQITLPIVTTLVPHFVFGVLDCWDLEKASTQSTRSVSRIWIPLLQKGPERLQQYSRLLWPQTFFPVKLVRKESIMGSMHPSDYTRGGSHSQLSEHSLFWAGEGSYTESTATPISKYVDPLSAGFHRSIQIKKPYATILSVPPWYPREAGSPFLLCFSRGTANYRLYGIFPSDSTLDAAWLAEKPPLLPLVLPRRIQGNVDKRDGGGLYGAVVVFKKRRVRPARFVAICLANMGQPDHDERRIKFIPRCKVIRGWDTWRAQDVQNIDFDELSDVDAEGEVLVTVQKVSSNPRSAAQGSESRFVGLTQVVFDRRQMIDELHLSPNQVPKAPEGILQHYGQECSDEDIGDLI
ncbi:HET domain-containing protein [Fusarium falciforme]|uniref:HET domain-containing protein n=1 Tax=Fusarium falciforme TaxID=195108 RepID=UPI00230008EB|nr:HET domain-containing protein [Fusarium falciforme]WAO84550.1 HET domain-containing protein [Fusarium falciforme]